MPDILTRIPVNYLGRILNITFFGFNIMFDRVLGVLALGLSGLALGCYCLRRRVSLVWFGILTAVLFSLNKWEMLTNGSGWAHFLSFACFYYHYEVMDRVWSGQEKRHDKAKLILLPFFKGCLREAVGRIRPLYPDLPSPLLMEQFLWRGRPCGSGHGAPAGPAKGHPWFFRPFLH